MARRRVGSVIFDVVALNLTDPALLAALGVDATDLTSKDRRTCQELAAIAEADGFEAILGPSAALAGETTLAVFGPAITTRADDVQDLGVRAAPR